MLGIRLWDKDEDPDTMVSFTENTEGEATKIHVGFFSLEHRRIPDVVITREQAYSLFMWLGHWLFCEHDNEITPKEMIWGVKQT